MSQGSLKRRLFLAGTASILVALALSGLGLLLLFERHVERRMVGELEAHLRQLVSGLERVDGRLQMARPPAEPRFKEPLGGLYWQIVEEPGATLRSRSLWDAALQLPPDELADGEVHEHRIEGPRGETLLVVERTLELPSSLGGGRLRVVVAVNRAELHAAGTAFALDLVPSLAMLAVLLVVGAWMQVAIGLRPLEAVRRRLADVSAGRAARLGASFPDEVRPLAAEVDHLLEAQEQAVARARARAADLAHGLKTPLTVLSSDVEELRAQGEMRIADEIAAVAATMRRHVDRELARARLGSRPRHGPAVAVRPVVEQVVSVLCRTPRGHELGWEVAVDDDAATTLDLHDLAEVVGNLADNATKWAESRVRILGRREGNAVVLVVEDDGPGIAEDKLGAVTARGDRLDESRPGSGLGLAIVTELLEAHGASLALGRSELGGLRAEVSLPTAGAAAS